MPGNTSKRYPAELKALAPSSTSVDIGRCGCITVSYRASVAGTTDLLVDIAGYFTSGA
jgi:hypothetical protein